MHPELKEIYGDLCQRLPWSGNEEHSLQGIASKPPNGNNSILIWRPHADGRKAHRLTFGRFWIQGFFIMAAILFYCRDIRLFI